MPNLAAVILRTHDPERLAAWFSETFGLPEPQARAEDQVGIPGLGCYLAFDRAAPGEALTAGATTIWLDVDDCAVRYEAALAAGATSRVAPHPCGESETLAELTDPEGHRIGLISSRS